ncbi:TIGR03086 family metal-binding protein [Blastococcus sp. TF02A-35]|uniref:TIGR03086 family metal-binding protein n=1 Tax=Blastococcus sp. TF02A-35 TaxID=2559612 RepID=UPI001073C458|nr:TIGR03086 family metal-binding protein [Blastococcus sp. TF02A_35]TFV47805.1 TIGR03086 family protein [Blastococcus sp. TF02A_35]
MQTTTLDLGPQTAEVARVAAGVRDFQLCHPTPCEGMSVAALLDHLVGLTLAFRFAAEKTPFAGGPSAAAANLAPDWRTRLPAQLSALADAWRQPDAWEGMADVADVRLPAPAMAAVALNEVLVHGWDLAVATGQPYRADDTAVEACLDFVGDRIDTSGEPEGLFGPVVPVPDGAQTEHEGHDHRSAPGQSGRRQEQLPDDQREAHPHERAGTGRAAVVVHAGARVRPRQHLGVHQQHRRVDRGGEPPHRTGREAPQVPGARQARRGHRDHDQRAEGGRVQQQEVHRGGRQREGGGHPAEGESPRPGGDDRRRHEQWPVSAAQWEDVDLGMPSAGLRSKKPTGLRVKPL